MSEVILHLTPCWSETIMVDPRPEPLCVVRRDYGGGLSVLLSLPSRSQASPVLLGFAAQVGEPDADFDAQGHCLAIRRWGLHRLGPGTWKVDPSIVEPSVGLHAYVVLCEVPEPPPWGLP